MIRGSRRLVINPTANQAHPRFSIVHSLKGLRIECKDCIEAALANSPFQAPTLPIRLKTNPKPGPFDDGNSHYQFRLRGR
jgi:hypothetical protein